MSAAGVQLARPQTLPADRTVMGHLLHALNQPLTGLQCALELATLAPRTPEQHVHTLREAVDLTVRMRILVEAIRELEDMYSAKSENISVFLLDRILVDTARELQPVAEAKGSHFLLAIEAPLMVRASRRRLSGLVFQLFSSAASLAREETDLQIAAAPLRGRACFSLSWVQGEPPPYSPFSPPELGLLIGQAGWEQAGGECTLARHGVPQTCTIRMALAAEAEFGRVASANVAEAET
jgi:hypothetical protein